MDPGQHLDQSGLARAVLADDGEDLAPIEIERDAVERFGPGEGFRDPAHPSKPTRPLGARSGVGVFPYGHSDANRLATSG
jgi:hypothetical protein